MLALGCGSDDEEPAIVAPPPETGSGEGGLETEAGELTPLGSGDPSGLGDMGVTGLIDGDPEEINSTCVDQFVGISERPPVIEFVVDTSGSMTWVAGTERLPDPGERSKWEITREALAGAIANMPDRAAVGISYYPNASGGGAQCYEPLAAAEIAPLTPEHRALIERVNSAQTPGGGTPTHSAYEFGIAQLEASNLVGSRFLVLITDGIPTFTLECAGDGQTRVDGAPLIASVDARNRDQGIRTFVIGSPGSEPARAELSEMARLGGTGTPGCESAAPGACHFDMTGEPDFSAALNDALGEIAEAALGCDYAVPEPPGGRGRIDLNDVSVVVQSGGNPVSEFQRASSADCESGWQFSADRTSIQLCRATCDELSRLASEDPDLSVSVKFGCVITPD